jgi:hypothetical protein
VLTRLVTLSKEADFAVFILAPDDRVEIRERTFATARDNIIFEAGLFMGTLGPERVFLLIPQSYEQLRTPSDFGGLTYITYRDEAGARLSDPTANLETVLTVPCARISEAAKRLGPRNPRYVAPPEQVPIYPRPDRPAEEWFEAFRKAIENPGRPFVPPVLYGCPGFAQFWWDLENSVPYEEQRESFTSRIRGALTVALAGQSKSEAVTIVDLGVGTLT